jgi:hypothetical protein
MEAVARRFAAIYGEVLNGSRRGERKGVLTP